MKTTNWILAVILASCSAMTALAALRQETVTNPDEQTEQRIEFLQHNFSKFVPLQFRMDTNSEAAIQILPVKTNRLEYEGFYYCGFKFTVPEWLDGDFKWMYLLAKTETNKNFGTKTLSWYIIPETGRSKGFQNFHQGG